jgi:hypothetical protein
MKTISPGILAAPRLLGAVAVSFLVAGCGGSTSPSYQPPGISQSARAQSAFSAVVVHDASCQGQQSFSHTGHPQKFKVPTCATSIYAEAVGAAGGGDGGEVSATIPVTPGESLVIMVGGAGRKDGGGGFNGGGAGATNGHDKIRGGGGGGASDVRQGGNTLADRVVVAGGGGGTYIGRSKDICPHCGAIVAPGGARTVRPDASGGAGGGLPDGGSGGRPPTCNLAGDPIGGGGGTQSSGGFGGAGSNGGSLGEGGTGASLCVNLDGFWQTINYSGGGGGGYYGGGGGGSGAGGGGGSGYAEPAATNVSSQSGVNSGNGSVLLCWGQSNGCGSR